MPDRESVPGVPSVADPEIEAALSGLPDDFVGFERIFETEIRPALIAREGDRLAAVAKARQARWIGGVIIVAGVVAGILVFKVPAIAIVSLVVGIGYIAWQGQDIRKLSRQAKALIVEPVARQFGLDFVAEPGSVASVHRHREVGILPAWDRSSYEDRLTGHRQDVSFELFEAHLEEKRTTRDSKGRTQTSWVTVFKGQCLRFAFPKQFYGRTLVTRDAGFFNRFGGGNGMSRAALEDPEFEKIFEVYTNDQVESRYLLTPDLMQRLVDLESTFRGGKLKCCFDGGEMYITLEGGDLFEPGSMFKRLDDPARIRDLLDDFAAIFHIIDSALENQRRERRERKR